MGKRNRRPRSTLQDRNSIRIDGQQYDVKDRIRLRGQLYLVLDRLAAPPRERFLVCDTSAGMQLRTLLVLPNGDATAQHLSVLRNLRNPHLPQIYNLHRQKDRTQVVLSWTRGIDLGEYLRRIECGEVNPPTPSHAVRLIHGIAQGLTTLHRHARIIHGDLKPENLILSRKPSRLSLIDFGSAWPIERTGFRHSGDGISPIYFAPEQQDVSTPVDERADQFVASLLLYRLLTMDVAYDGLGGQAGRPQFFDPDNRPIAPSESLVHPRFLPRRLRNQLDDVVLTGLALDPGQRYGTSNAWLDALKAVHLQLELRDASGETRSGLWQRFRHWLTSRRPERQTARNQPTNDDFD